MYQEDDVVVSHSYSGVPPANVSKSLDGSSIVAVRLTVAASPTAGVNTIVPVAAPKAVGAATATSTVSPAGTTTDASAVKPPVVAIATVLSSVPGFLMVIVFVVLGFTSPKASVSPALMLCSLKPGPSTAVLSYVKVILGRNDSFVQEPLPVAFLIDEPLVALTP